MIFSMRDVMAMNTGYGPRNAITVGLERGDNLDERRDGYGPRTGDVL